MKDAVERARKKGFGSSAVGSMLSESRDRAEEMKLLMERAKSHRTMVDEKNARLAIVSMASSLEKSNRIFFKSLGSSIESGRVSDLNEVVIGFEAVMEKSAKSMLDSLNSIGDNCDVVRELRKAKADRGGSSGEGVADGSE